MRGSATPDRPESAGTSTCDGVDSPVCRPRCATITGVPARILSFPFRISPSGVAATVEHGSDAEIDELLAVGALTAPGERILAPTFGVDDPVFTGFEIASLQRHCNDFGPAVTITVAEPTRRGDDREELTLGWERRGGER